MAKLAIIRRLKPFLAPRKIRFIDPDTLYKYRANTRTELVQKIVTYRAQNELPPIENLDLALEHFWCSMPENKHLCHDVTLERGWMTYLKGGLNLIKTVIFDKVVPLEEAERRASICAGCPHNVNPNKANWDKWADEIAEHAVGDKKTSFHQKLFNCEVCTCNLRAKVFYDGPMDLDKEEKEKLPSFCWQLSDAK